jgi:hypothetical protein
MEDEEASRWDKARREFYEEGDDISDAIENNANIAHDYFLPQPTGSYAGTPMPRPYFSTQQHSGMDLGTEATALFALGLAIERLAAFGMERWTKRPREGTEHAGN